jgi:hypothetical protein
MVAATPKAAMATADLSAPLRQGGVLGSRFPKEWGKAAAESTTYFKSQANYDKAMKEISERPTYELMKKAGLAVDGANGITGTEEQFMSSLLETDVAKKLQSVKLRLRQIVGIQDSLLSYVPMYLTRSLKMLMMLA